MQFCSPCYVTLARTAKSIYIPEVLELVRSVQAKFNPSLKIAGILITMYQSKPQLCESIRESVVDVYQHEDADFMVGENVMLIVQRYEDEKLQMYGKIMSKW